MTSEVDQIVVRSGVVPADSEVSKRRLDQWIADDNSALAARLDAGWEIIGMVPAGSVQYSAPYKVTTGQVFTTLVFLRRQAP